MKKSREAEIHRVLLHMWSLQSYLSKHNAQMLVSICLKPSAFPLTHSTSMSVFWVFQYFSIYDLVTLALDILSLLHSSYTHGCEHKCQEKYKHTQTPHPLPVNDLNPITCRPPVSVTWCYSEQDAKFPFLHIYLYEWLSHRWQSNEHLHAYGNAVYRISRP